jgi:hypothetical protein
MAGLVCEQSRPFYDFEMQAETTTDHIITKLRWSLATDVNTFGIFVACSKHNKKQWKQWLWRHAVFRLSSLSSVRSDQ